MDNNKFQPSFIPKKPVLENSSRSSSTSGGILYTLAEVVFGFSVIACIGIFGYSKLLEGQIAKMSGDLKAARETVQPELIHDLSRASGRFVSAQKIINNHVTLTRLFSLIESLTLQTVRFNDFSYSADQTGALSIAMGGEARSYSTLALQSDIFLNNSAFKNPQFSNLDLNTKGNVTFAFKSKVDPSVVSYVKGLEEGGAQAVPAPIETVAPVTDVIVTNAPATTTPTSTPAKVDTTKTKKP